jgi:putative DNA methylase
MWSRKIHLVLITSADGDDGGRGSVSQDIKSRTKLIEVALPLNAINEESLHRKQKAPKGWPTSFHKWWAQRPLAACRAVIFASLVDDPSCRPDKFPTEEAQDRERERLFRLIEQLVKWENSGNEQKIAEAWHEILESTGGTPPPLLDPFSGSGSIPLEGQRLGLEVHASDLNPVAVLINKAMIELPYVFAKYPPVNPKSLQDRSLIATSWVNARGLAEDVRHYSQWLRVEVEKRIGNLYPKIAVTNQTVQDRPDLTAYLGQELDVIAWLWVRTVKSPNPAFAHVDVPLASSFVLSSKAGKEAYVHPVIGVGSYHFEVKVGKGENSDATKRGTKANGKASGFLCLMSGIPIPFEYLRSEAKAGRMGTRLMAVVAEGDRGRIYLPPTPEQELASRVVRPENVLDTELPKRALGFRIQEYGMTRWRDMFSARQLTALSTFSDLIAVAREQVLRDALAAGLVDDGRDLDSGGTGATAYGDAMAIYLSCVVDRMAYYGSTLTTWLPKDNALRDCMPRQALSMIWDFAEGNPFTKSSGDVKTCSNVISNYLECSTPNRQAIVTQQDATALKVANRRFLISTDPPYFDNIGYADLSDYFYVWLRRSLKIVLPKLFSTLAVPKAEELVASPFRQGSKEKAELFFLQGMTKAMHRLAELTDPEYPVTIYYAFKQSETDDEEGTASTGWETFLEAVIRAGFTICGTWPMRTEGAGRMRASHSNALASSIVLVCRTRSSEVAVATRRDLLAVLREELPGKLRHLQRSNIAPVDLQQAAIGPGMAVYTRYGSVLDASGKSLTVRDALTLINQMLDEALAEQEGDFDADTRWALAWFEQSGFAQGEYGVAETLSKAKNTSIGGMVEAGILASKSGKVRLLRPDELSATWDPSRDARLTTWEVVHQLIRVLELKGESAAADLVAKLGGKAEIARELAYRLYTLCERNKRAQEALAYNGLVQSWPEILRLSREGGAPPKTQTGLFEQSEE